MLASAALFAPSLSAAPQTAGGSRRVSGRDAVEMAVRPQSGAVFAGEESAFSALIPAARPSEVRTELPTLPEGAELISLRRSDAPGGTKIELLILFAAPGTYSLPPLSVRAGGRSYSVPFAPVTVTENPATVPPRMVVRFRDGTTVLQSGGNPAASLLTLTAGKTAEFTVFVQYAVQIESFDFSVPKDAILTEIERYDSAKAVPAGTGFSDALIPVARFEWCPLASGNTALPEFRAVATAYNGGSAELFTPPAVIAVRLPDASDAPPRRGGVSAPEEYFADAFTAAAAVQAAPEKNTVSASDCGRLAALRSAERRAFFPAARNERRQFEEALGMAAGDAETPLWILYAAAALSAAAVCAVVLAAARRRFRAAAAFASALAAALFLTAALCVRLSAEYAVLKNGNVRSVPEADADFVSGMKSGDRVRILRSAAGWLYVGSEKSRGWVAEQDVILIQ